jgi:hypothetical protein
MRNESQRCLIFPLVDDHHRTRSSLEHRRGVGRPNLSQAMPYGAAEQSALSFDKSAAHVLRNWPTRF